MNKVFINPFQALVILVHLFQRMNELSSKQAKEMLSVFVIKLATSTTEIPKLRIDMVKIGGLVISVVEDAE